MKVDDLSKELQKISKQHENFHNIFVIFDCFFSYDGTPMLFTAQLNNNSERVFFLETVSENENRLFICCHVKEPDYSFLVNNDISIWGYIRRNLAGFVEVNKKDVIVNYFYNSFENLDDNLLPIRQVGITLDFEVSDFIKN